MRKEPFPIKNILDSLREDVQNGTISLSQAAEELHRAGWSNYIDEDVALRKESVDRNRRARRS